MSSKKVTVLIVGIIVIILVCFGIYTFLTKQSQQEDNQQQQSGDSLNESNMEDDKPLFTEETYPRIDGSTATIPLSEAFKAEFLGKEINEVEVHHNTTHNAYLNLINGDADLILVTYPSEEEEALAKQKGMEFEIIPVVNEAFVFYTNIDNTVKSLTLEQIQKIYTGEIKNWSEVGGNDAEITAYQREPNSGSQSGMLKLVMNGLNLMEPLKENIVMGMEAIIGLVADYDNGINSIGYSYYYYATTMYDIIDSSIASRIDLLAVDGVEPNNETIKNGTYPIRTNYYIVIDKAEPEDSDVRKLVRAMLSEDGQAAAEAVGYVGMKNK